jgi:hypothetical protein
MALPRGAPINMTCLFKIYVGGMIMTTVGPVQFQLCPSCAGDRQVNARVPGGSIAMYTRPCGFGTFIANAAACQKVTYNEGVKFPLACPDGSTDTWLQLQYSGDIAWVRNKWFTSSLGSESPIVSYSASCTPPGLSPYKFSSLPGVISVRM